MGVFSYIALKKMNMEVVDQIKGLEELGRRLCIPKDAKVFNNGKFFQRTIMGESIEVLIGIGNNHTVSLVMDVEAYEEFKKGTKLIF